MGSLLCDNCKYNITNESLNECVECSEAVIDNTCGQCDLPYERSWCVGERDGILREIIDRYKFENAKAGSETLADLLDETISHMPMQTIVVPIPTIPAHIRQRGYDHALLLANKFAKKRSLSVQKVLSRAAHTTQRGASRKQRRLQAEQAFTVRKTLKADTPYLIVDDITTTGATLRYAAEALRDAGAKIIWVAVVAKQPLD